MNNMEKKEYIKPEMTVYQIKAPTILAGSNIKMAEEGDYNNVDDMTEIVDGFGTISGD